MRIVGKGELTKDKKRQRLVRGQVFIGRGRGKKNSNRDISKGVLI